MPQGLLEILSSASEFDNLAIRPGEEEAVRKLLMHAPVPVVAPRYTDPHTKANALLQAHFSRTHLGGDLAVDQAQIVTSATRLLQVPPPPTRYHDHHQLLHARDRRARKSMMRTASSYFGSLLNCSTTLNTKIMKAYCNCAHMACAKY